MKRPETITVIGVGPLGKEDKREYRIGFVSNWYAVNYYDLRKQVFEAQRAYYTLTDVQDKVASGEMEPEQAAELVNASADVINAIGTKDFFEHRIDLVKEILEVNGIDFDRKTWERRTSPEELVKFLDAVYSFGTKSEEPHGEEKPKKRQKA